MEALQSSIQHIENQRHRKQAQRLRRLKKPGWRKATEQANGQKNHGHVLAHQQRLICTSPTNGSWGSNASICGRSIDLKIIYK